MARPLRVPNWLPWQQTTAYFITFCVDARKPMLANAAAWAICRKVFDRLNQWIVLSAIAMPDHLHILAVPLDREGSVSAFSKWFKRWFNEAYAIKDCRPSVSDGGPIVWRWQEGCFDRLLRSEESLSEKWEYLRQNPVRAGLASNADDWLYQFQFNEPNCRPSL